jgi:hypothetical protein
MDRTQPPMGQTAHQPTGMVYVTSKTEATISTAFTLAFEDLQLAGELVELRLAPGSGEADRAARVRSLLDASAELNYAISTYTHRVLAYAGRRPANGGLRDDTVALQDALDGFAREVRALAHTYREMQLNRDVR